MFCSDLQESVCVCARYEVSALKIVALICTLWQSQPIDLGLQTPGSGLSFTLTSTHGLTSLNKMGNYTRRKKIRALMGRHDLEHELCVWSCQTVLAVVPWTTAKAGAAGLLPCNDEFLALFGISSWTARREAVWWERPKLLCCPCSAADLRMPLMLPNLTGASFPICKMGW